MNLRFPSIFLLFLLSFAVSRGQDGKPLNFEEVFSLIKTNLTDIPENELNRLAAIGLVKELGTKVQLVSTNDTNSTAQTDSISRKAIYNESYGYIRINNFQPNLPNEFEKEFRELGLNKKLKGLVIDLRYARGQDYDAAARLADKFIKGGQLLVKFGEKEMRSSEKPQPITLPVAILVNGQTAGAAEALAGILREAGAGLVIGQTTAGAARLFETFPLSTGQKIRIGKIPVQLSDGKSIPAKGLTPDIPIVVQTELERALYQDPYKSLNLAFAETNEVSAATNRTARRFNEAELVRRHREGAVLDNEEDGPGAAEPAAPVIMDPALARAIDFLKGIAVLQEHRS